MISMVEFYSGEPVMSAQPLHVLLVEDDDVDAEVVRRAFTELKISNPTTRVVDGYEALEVLRGTNDRERIPRPYVILLDLNMPRMNGLEFLRQLRSDPELRSSVVFVLTTSQDDRDIVAAYNLQVAGYFLKTSVGEGFFNLPRMMESYWRMVEFPVNWPR
jgi:CheY-like chemotaxis protein